MLVNVRFYRYLANKSFIKFLIYILFVFNFTFLNSNEKIIYNFNNFESLKFDFKQKSFEKVENGICYLKRPHFLKCIYDDKNQKELIINKNILVIYHKRYKKVYRYPISKTYFLDILNKQKFSTLIKNGELLLNEKYIEIKYLDEEKGEITFFFDRENYELVGWRFIDVNKNVVFLEIQNYFKNIEIKQNFFIIPEENL